LTKSVTGNVVSDVLGQDHLHAIIEQAKMLRKTYHIVIKTFMKFLLIGLHYDEHVTYLFQILYDISVFF